MSHTGKLQRGEVWYNYRDIDGNYPHEITIDPVKMADLNYYLDSLKTVTKKKTEAK